MVLLFLRGGDFLKMSERRYQRQSESSLNLPGTSVFKSSIGRIVPLGSIRELCGNCQYTSGDNQCKIFSPTTQADNTGSKKCDWKKP